MSMGEACLSTPSDHLLECSGQGNGSHSLFGYQSSLPNDHANFPAVTAPMLMHGMFRAELFTYLFPSCYCVFVGASIVERT